MHKRKGERGRAVEESHPRWKGHVRWTGALGSIQKQGLCHGSERHWGSQAEAEQRQEIMAVVI